MGKLNMGILGGFSGTVGTVVGSTNKRGDNIIRAKSKKARTSFTEGQVNQQTKFGMVTGYMRPLNFLLKNSFKIVADVEMSPYNYACKVALDEAVIGIAPDFELDYAKVLISEGELSRETTSGAELVDGVVNFHWNDNTGSGKCASTDQAVLLVYNVDKSEVSYSIGAATRETKEGNLPLPYNVTGDKILFYLFFQSADDPTIVSTSQFLGSVEITE